MRLSILLLIAAAGPCIGAAIQSASVESDSSYSDGPTTGTAQIPLTLLGSGNATGTGYAMATPGVLHASVTGVAIDTSFGARARVTTDGTITFTCTGTCGPTTTVSLNIDLDGSGEITNGLGFAHADLYGLLNGNAFYFTRYVGGIAGIATLPGPFSLVNYVHTTPTFTVPVNVPVPLYLQLGTVLSHTAGAGLTSTASIDFANTVQLSRLGPVFNLAPGYSASSADFNIVDNQFSPVPEPATTLTMGIALAFAAWYRRRHN